MSAKDHFILELTIALEKVTHCKHEESVITAVVQQSLRESETNIGYSYSNNIQGEMVKSYLSLICNIADARKYLAADLRQGLAEELVKDITDA